MLDFFTLTLGTSLKTSSNRWVDFSDIFPCCGHQEKIVLLSLSLMVKSYAEPHGVCSVRRLRRRPHGVCWRAAQRVEVCGVHAAGCAWDAACGPQRGGRSRALVARGTGAGEGGIPLGGAPGDASSHPRGAGRGRRDSASPERVVVEAEQRLQGHAERPRQADDGLDGHLGCLGALLNPRDGDIRDPGTLREGFLRQPLDLP